jgi:hypothetical protein
MSFGISLIVTLPKAVSLVVTVCAEATSKTFIYHRWSPHQIIKGVRVVGKIVKMNVVRVFAPALDPTPHAPTHLILFLLCFLANSRVQPLSSHLLPPLTCFLSHPQSPSRLDSSHRLHWFAACSCRLRARTIEEPTAGYKQLPHYL